MKSLILSNGSVTVLDDEDYGWASKFKWFQNNSGYAARYVYGGKSRKLILLHREILERLGVVARCVDHANGNKLLNTRNNLRAATVQQNAFNMRKHRGKSRYKGVSPSHNKSNPWHSRLMHNGKTYSLRNWPTEEKAAEAYNRKAKELFGEFALLNEVEHEA